MFRRTLIAAGAALLVSAALHAPAARAQTVVTLHAVLNGGQEVPPTSSKATGTLNGTYNTKTKVLDYTITCQGFASPVMGAHFHGPAMQNQQNAGVVLPIPNPQTSPIHGQATLTDQQADQLLQGQWYVNIHTRNNPQGAIRGQVEKG